MMLQTQTAIEHLSKDKNLQKVIQSTELPGSEPSKDIYISLIRSITSQQISTQAAKTIYTRFRALFNDQYPDPENLLKQDVDALREVGLSRQKASYILNIARFDLDYGIDYKKLEKMTDTEIIQYLTQIKGVGKWTVEMILMFAMDRPDVFPVDDLGIQQAMMRLYNLEGDKKEIKVKMKKIAEAWQPYRTLACKYLWKWKDRK